MNVSDVVDALTRAGFRFEVSTSVSIQVLTDSGERIHIGNFTTDDADVSKAEPDNGLGIVHVHHQGMPESDHNYVDEETIDGVLFQVVAMSQDPELGDEL